MSEQPKTYENYPWWSIVISDLVPLAVYIIAGTIIYQFGLVWFLTYLVYFAILELSFYPRSCVYCYYYGKWCFCGKGKVASLLFKQKDPKKFCERKATPVKMIPDLLVIVMPLALGIVLLIKDFDWWIAALMILDLFLTTYGNSLIRGKLACLHCKQCQICCPARDMFNKVTKK